MAEVEIGKVMHYFGHLGVAALQLTNGTLGVGDTVHIKGHTSDITAKVNSMEVNHVAIHDARVGDSIGIRVPRHVREHDHVFKVMP